MLGSAPRKGVSAALVTLAFAGLASNACSVRKVAIAKVADALASGGDVFSSDDDPELIGAALPFTLKTMEGLLTQDPTNEDLLLAAASGFTKYSWGWVQLPAQRLADTDYTQSQRQLGRARRLYLRARDYGLRGLEQRQPGIGERLRLEPATAAATLGADELPFLYWTAAAWAGAIGVGKDQPELLADLPTVLALIDRAVAIDEKWEGGVAHEVSIVLAAALPEGMGGGVAKARNHFDRSIAISQGRHASPYLALAEGVAIPAQDRASFEALLQQALAVDVDAEPLSRVANLLAQDHASWLLENADVWFLDGGDDTTAEPTEEPQPDPPASTGRHHSS
jgi:hypothetical protein